MLGLRVDGMERGLVGQEIGMISRESDRWEAERTRAGCARLAGSCQCRVALSEKILFVRIADRDILLMSNFPLLPCINMPLV